MMDKRGQATTSGTMNFIKIILWVAAIYLAISIIGLIFYGDFGVPDEVLEGAEQKVGEAVEDTESNANIFNTQGARFLDFVIGQIPSTLIDWTSNVSAFIIVLGVWVLLLVTFGDIISLFGTFSKPTSWIIATVITIIAANLKVIIFFSVVGLILASGLGVIAIFVNIIGIIVVFIGFNYGTSAFRNWVLKRKEAELKMKAAMGSAKAEAGLKTMQNIGNVSLSGGNP